MSQIILGALTTLNLSTHLDAMFTELYELRNVFGVSSGVPRASGGLLIGSNDVYVYAGSTDVFSLRVGPSSNYTFVDVKSMGGGYPMIDAPGGTLGLGVLGAAKLAVEATAIRPATDNAISAGTASFRYSVVYAGTGAINTSDAREKSAVEPLSAAEVRAATRLARAVGSFQFLAAIAEKGAAARRHIGLTVQQAIAILEDEGLQPMRYAFICHDEWAEREEAAVMENRPTGLVDSKGRPLTEQVVVSPARTIQAGDRYGFRTDELLMFIARGLEARITSLEAAA